MFQADSTPILDTPDFLKDSTNLHLSEDSSEPLLDKGKKVWQYKETVALIKSMETYYENLSHQKKTCV